MWLVSIASALAAPGVLRGEQPTKAAIRATERSFHCEPESWTLIRTEPDGASFTVNLCGTVQALTVRRVGRAWGFQTDVDLRRIAPEDLGCPSLEYVIVDLETRIARGCGFEATYRDAGMKGWVRQVSEDHPGYTEVAVAVSLGEEPVLGDPSAPFVVLDYTDFACPGCASSFGALRELTFAPKIQVRSRQFPLDSRCNPSVPSPAALPSCEAAIAAICAHRQGHYWEYAAALYAGSTALGEALFSKAAADIGLDPVAFSACRSDPSARAALDADIAAGQAFGVDALPARLVRGLRGESWISVCGAPAEIAAMVRSAEARKPGADPDLPISAAKGCSE